MFESLSVAIKDEELDERSKTRLHSTVNLLKLSSNDIFLISSTRSRIRTSDIPDELQDQFYDLQNDSSARDVFLKWHSLRSGVLCLILPQLGFRILLSFATIYICGSV